MEPISRDEDMLLRRLAWFAEHGVDLGEKHLDLLGKLRQRDKRSSIRPPVDLMEHVIVNETNDQGLAPSS